MPTGLFSQIALIILSVGIIFTYISPTLDKVKKTQDNIVVYQTEKAKVSEVTEKLDQVASRLNSISSDDQRRLLTYMPDSVDTVAVPRDIKAIADNSGLILKQIEYSGVESSDSNSAFVDTSVVAAPTVDPHAPEAHTFTVDFEGSYEQVKQFLGDLEKNAYPLEVHDMAIKKTEGGFLSVGLKVVTYDRIKPALPTDPFAITQVTS